MRVRDWPGVMIGGMVARFLSLPVNSDMDSLVSFNFIFVRARPGFPVSREGSVGKRDGGEETRSAWK